MPALRADLLLIENIRSLLLARRINRQDLARWCGHKPAWISKILSGERGVNLKDLSPIADFFGLTVAELFHPGISSVTERRRRDRRILEERRAGEDRRTGKRPPIHESANPFPRHVKAKVK